MKTRLRATSFTLTVLMLAILIGWATQASWRELRLLHHSFASMQSDGFHRSKHVEAEVRALNEIMLRTDAHATPEDRSQFLSQSDALKQWLLGQEASATPSERTLLNQIAAALDAYVVQCASILSERAKSGSIPNRLVNAVGNEAIPILDLCRKLDAAERAALAEFVMESRQGLGFLQVLLFASLFLLVAMGGVMLLRVYRQTVAPLRAQLVESRASVEREEKLAALGTLAAGVAHEIRNPLTAINVRVHSLKRTLVAGSSEHEDAAVIDQEIQRLDRIVREFLQFARPPDAEFVTVTAERLFANVQRLLHPQLKNAAIRLTVEPVPAVWIRVDPQQMEQVLINLIQNAAESIGRDGAVTLRARTGVARLTGRSRPVLILEVTDTGRGIPPAVQRRLFDPFFTTKETGTGLGLPIAARIVEKHGGMLQYKTELGRGATFGVVLPRAEKDENENQA